MLKIVIRAFKFVKFLSKILLCFSLEATNIYTVFVLSCQVQCLQFLRFITEILSSDLGVTVPHAGLWAEYFQAFKGPEFIGNKHTR